MKAGEHQDILSRFESLRLCLLSLFLSFSARESLSLCLLSLSLLLSLTHSLTLLPLSLSLSHTLSISTYSGLHSDLKLQALLFMLRHQLLFIGLEMIAMGGCIGLYLLDLDAPNTKVDVQ